MKKKFCALIFHRFGLINAAEITASWQPYSAPPLHVWKPHDYSRRHADLALYAWRIVYADRHALIRIRMSDITFEDAL
jgi:hypothetical protein